MKRIIAFVLVIAVTLGTFTAVTAFGENQYLWKYIDGAADTVITETSANIYSAGREAGGFRIMTTQKFDPRQKKVSVVLGKTDKDWFTFGVVGGDGSAASLGNTQNGLDFIIHVGTGNLWNAYLYRNARPAANYGDHLIRDFSATHTFGFNRQDGNWYLTIDGRILNSDIINSEINQVLDNNSEIYFVLGAQGSASFTDIEIVDNDEFKAWLPLSGEPEISKNSDSSYDLSGSGEVISGDIYDIERHELSFVSAAMPSKPLRIGIAYEDSDGNIIQKGITAEIKDGECKLGFYGEEGDIKLPQTVELIPDKEHIFSIKNRKGVYYPSLDGVIIDFPEEQIWQDRLKEFNDFVKACDGKVKFTFFSDDRLDLTNVSVLSVKTELVPHKSYDGNNDYAGTVTLQAENGLGLSGKSSFITSETYNAEEYDLSFMVTEAGDFINLAVTNGSDLENIGKPQEDSSVTATRVDFLISTADSGFYVKESTGTEGYTDLSYDEKVTALNTAHTFGLRKADGHWYPAIDGVALTSQISERLDKFIEENGCSSLRFAIGGDGKSEFKAENVGIVENTQKMFLNYDPNNTGSIVNQPNGSVILSGGNKADFFTEEAYDITEQDFKFTVGDLDNGRMYLSFAAAEGDISKQPGEDFSEPSRIDFQVCINSSGNSFLISFDAENGAKQSEFVAASAYLKDNFENKTHTFGLREVNGQWYPAIDGFAYTENPAKEPANALKLINDFVEKHGTELRFGVATNHEIGHFILTDVGVTDIKEFAAHGDTVGDVETGEDGYNILTGEHGMFLTTNSYNIENYDLQFNLEATPTEFIGLSVTKADLPSNISTNFGSDFNNPTRIDFRIYPQYNQIVICFNSTDGSAPQATFNAATSNLQKSLKAAAHTFGLRKIGEHWYPAIDGTAYTVVAKGEQNPTKILDDFLNEQTDVRFGIGGQKDFKIEAKVAEYNTLWGACSGGGVINKESGGTTSVDDFYLSMRTVDTYDITENDLQFNFTDFTGDWVSFGLAPANDSDSDQATSLGQSMVFIARFGQKGALSYLVNGAEKPIANLKYDLDAVHTFGIRELDGHWYPAIDGYIINYEYSDEFDAFVNENKADGFRFVLGAHNYFSAKDIKIIDAVESVVKPIEGWDIYPGNASLEGNESDGYSLNFLSGFYAAFSNAKYDMRKTSLSFKCNNAGDYIYFSVSAGDARTEGVLPVGEDPTRFIFILRPAASDIKVIASYWNIDGVSAKETVITTRKIDWFKTHTVDIRQLDENWFLCIDGVIYQSRVSTVLNNFMNKHVDEGLNYGIGGTGTVDLAEIKVIDQVPLSQESGNIFEDGTLDDENVDWGFDFGEDLFGDLEFDDTNTDDLPFTDGDDKDSFFNETELNDPDNDDSLKVIGRVKKKKLVSAGHGYIFEWYEISAMIMGGAVLAGGIAITTVFLIKRRKKSQS